MASRVSVIVDILKKLEETGQIYIPGLDMPLSITKSLFQILDARRRAEAEKRGIPEIQFDYEAILGVLLGLE